MTLADSIRAFYDAVRRTGRADFPTVVSMDVIRLSRSRFRALMGSSVCYRIVEIEALTRNVPAFQARARQLSIASLMTYREAVDSMLMEQTR